VTILIVRIKEYLTLRGISPFSKWYRKLDEALQTRLDARFQRIKILDNLGDNKSVGMGVFELRFMMRSGLRVYFGKEDNDIVVLLVGGNKSSHPKDIEKAKEYWIDYKLRKEEDHGK